MESGGTSQNKLNLDVDQNIYENVNMYTVHQSSRVLLDLNVKPKKPIPPPRSIHNIKISNGALDNFQLELESKLLLKQTGAIRKSGGAGSRSSDSSNSSQAQTKLPGVAKDGLPTPKTPEDSLEPAFKRSNSIFKSFRKIFGSKKHKKSKKGQPSSPKSLQSLQSDDETSKHTAVFLYKQEDLDNCDVPKLRRPPVCDPPSYDDALRASSSEEQQQFQQFCQRISGRISARLLGASAPPIEECLEEKLMYENVDKAMQSYFDVIKNMKSTLTPEKASTQQTISDETKLSTLTREILNEFDPNNEKLKIDEHSHILWMDKLCAYFDTSVKISGESELLSESKLDVINE